MNPILIIDHGRLSILREGTYTGIPYLVQRKVTTQERQIIWKEVCGWFVPSAVA